MPRITVPEEFDAGHISVAGEKDFHAGDADVTTDAVDHARDLSVRQDDDGTRYVGCSEHYADDVREFLGVDPPEEDEPEEGEESDTAKIEAGECPWCDDYDGDAVPQHASSAHPDKWGDYKGETDE